ncbi:MAG: hypothetical protein HC828_17265, partial [Blastochloris sp.]|nr:hypothetical protein [Blastochloris sp.]
MHLRTWWAQCNQALGFERDERHQVIQSRAARNGYLTTLIASAVVASYQHLTGWPAAPLWPVGLSMLLSLIVVAVYRLALVGMAGDDERVLRLRPPLFFWSYLTLTIGLFSYSSVLFWSYGDTPAMMLWSLCYLLALPVLWATHLWHQTIPGRPWLWLLVAVVVWGSLTPRWMVVHQEPACRYCAATGP